MDPDTLQHTIPKSQDFSFCGFFLLSWQQTIFIT